MLTSQFLPEVFGGAEQQCLRLSREIAAKGHKVTVLTSRQQLQTRGEEEVDGVSIVRLWTKFPPQLGGMRIGHTLAWTIALNRWLKANADRVGIIHCHQAKLNAVIGVVLARQLSVPCIVKVGSAGPNLDFRSLEKKRLFYGKLASRHVAKHASKIVAISSEMLRDLYDYGVDSQRCVHIPNGCQPLSRNQRDLMRTRDAIRQRHDIQRDDVLITFVGRMEVQKNVLTLIDAFTRVASDAPKAKLAMIGDGALLSDAQDRAKALIEKGTILFTGRISNVDAYLAASDIFVLPAYAEGMSNALLEAMSFGLPSIVSAVSGNTDLVQPGRTGWIYGDPADRASLVKCLLEALALDEGARRQLGQAAKAIVEQEYQMPSIADRYIALYREVLRT